MTNFSSWLGKLLGQSEHEITRMLADKSALHFLLAWSLFESKCFAGYIQKNKIQKFAIRVAADSALNIIEIKNIASYFHGRYQNNKLFMNLIHGNKCQKLQGLIERPFAFLNNADVVFLVVFVVFRFRNNIFHGNKDINSWLNFKEQIDFCTEAMQFFVTHGECLTPSMKEPANA